MADFEAHLNQARKNLKILEQLNSKISNSLDWQVTVAFFTAVHAVNAYLAKEVNLHYKTHQEVDNAINPFNNTSMVRLPEPVYLSYEKIKNLSRRSRYLCNNLQANVDPNLVFLTGEKELRAAIVNLDKFLSFIGSRYTVDFGKHNIIGKEFSKGDSFQFFKIF